MSALDDARASAEQARALIDALEEVADFGEDAFADLKQAVNRVFNLLAPFAVPPIGDERVALEDLITDRRDEYPRDPRDMPSAELAEIILAAGFRRRGPITGEMVASALEAWDGHLGTGILGEDAMRAALEAALATEQQIGGKR